MNVPPQLDATQYLQAVLCHVPQLIWVKDTQGSYIDANPRFGAFFGVSQLGLVGKTDDDFFEPETAQQCRLDDRLCQQTQTALVREKWVTSVLDGRQFLLEITKVAMRDANGRVTGVLAVAQDVTQSRQTDRLESFRGRMLEMLAKGVVLHRILDALARGVHALYPTMRCSVFLVSQDGRRLSRGAAPDLAGDFADALRGQPLTSGAGGFAAVLIPGQRVIVPDVTVDSKWVRLQGLASQGGVRACWSQPALATDGKVLAVVSIYHSSIQVPSPADLAFLEWLGRVAGMAIEQHQAAKRLREGEERFRALAEHTPEAIVVHADTCIVYVNPAAVKMFGARTPAQLLGTSTLERIHPLYLEEQMTRLADLVAQRPVEPLVQTRFVRLDGQTFDVEVQDTPIVYAGQDAVHLSIRDVTQRRQIEQRLELAASVFNHSNEGIIICALDGTIFDVNEAFTRITGYSRDEAMGRKPEFLRSGHHKPSFFDNLWRNLQEKGYWAGEIWNRRKTGEVYVQTQHISAVRNERGEVSQYVAFFTDITARKEQEARLNHMAHFDALTGLPNRALLADRLQQAMVQATRRGQQFGLAFVDLDGFKTINDTYGHEAGDHLLITLAGRMRLALREVDTLARIGGDEFAAVMVDLEDQRDCEPLLRRLLSAASQPVIYNNAVLQVSASVGVSFYPQGKNLSAEELLRQADMAMYQAKQGGKNQYQISGHADFLD